jgi:hypothetical protein
MGRGSPLVCVRIPAELHELLLEAVRRSQHHDSPHTVSSFIVAALEEKFRKMARSAKRKSPLPVGYARDKFTF